MRGWWLSISIWGWWRYQWHLQQERQLLFDPKLAARMSRNKPIRWFWCHGATICSMRIWIYWSIHKSAANCVAIHFKIEILSACGLDRVLIWQEATIWIPEHSENNSQHKNWQSAPTRNWNLNHPTSENKSIPALEGLTPGRSWPMLIVDTHQSTSALDDTLWHSIAANNNL